MKTLLVLSLFLLAFAATAPVASAEDCRGVSGVQELCTYYGSTGEQCYYWKGIVLDGHHVC